MARGIAYRLLRFLVLFPSSTEFRLKKSLAIFFPPLLSSSKKINTYGNLKPKAGILVCNIKKLNMKSYCFSLHNTPVYAGIGSVVPSN